MVSGETVDLDGSVTERNGTEERRRGERGIVDRKNGL